MIVVYNIINNAIIDPYTSKYDHMNLDKHNPCQNIKACISRIYLVYFKLAKTNRLNQDFLTNPPF